MNSEHLLVETWRELPLERQQEVLDFAEFLKAKSITKRPKKSLEGLWAGLNIDISDQDIAEAKREMWQNFPKEVNQ